jgi:hypothetical protein
MMSSKLPDRREKNISDLLARAQSVQGSGIADQIWNTGAGV